MTLRLFLIIGFSSNLIFAATIEFNRTPIVANGKLCYNGRKDSVKGCVCDPNYTGELCERKKHCLGFDRQANFSCIDCVEGWTGDECDFIKCEHGIADSREQTCKCDQPYSGAFCKELKTENVYLFYNKAIYSSGPIGALSILLLICILLCCNHFEKKSHLERAEAAIEQQFQKDVSSDLVQILLKK